MAQEKKLEVKNLRVSFRTQGGTVKAVRDISFDLYKGETLAIVGESGSGKSVTSKSIIGILAGNSIVEGGEILYDGQDLLKISEDDFHEIRGDKISMIFQDPLSSLNPIMRVGRQLTEAMILNGKARQRNAKKDFNGKLALLNKNMDCILSDTENNKKLCRTFDSFCIESTKLEQIYNDANAKAEELKSNAENIIFLIDKNQKIDFKKEVKNAIDELNKATHNYVFKADETSNLVTKLNSILSNGKKVDLANARNVFAELMDVATSASSRKAPNFFRLGYYKLNNPSFDETSMDVEDLDKMTLEYLDNHFMKEFIEKGSEGLKYSHDESIKLKKETLPLLNELLDYFRNADVIKTKDISSKVKQAYASVKHAIDFMRVRKKSAEHSFKSSLNHEIERYEFGLKNNPKQKAKYERNLAKYNKLIEAGKNPTWQVIPPTYVDLDLTKDNIIKIIENLIKSYNASIDNAPNYDYKKHMVELVDHFKEQSSRYVYRVTKSLAKAKALNLLKEVGIPEPAIRYKQYPFEFSGGMRQRIVIAIALSANPDILICDEPTTALDVTIQSQILELINKIKVERNLSVIFITHDLGVVANMADKIAVMYAGKIVEYGTNMDVFYDPRHPYTWALLSSMPDLDTKEKLEAIPGTPPNMIYPPKGDAFAERNIYAMDIDFEVEPPLFEISDTHYAATWLLHPNAPHIDPPKIVTDRIERMKKEAAKYE